MLSFRTAAPRPFVSDMLARQSSSLRSSIVKRSQVMPTAIAPSKGAVQKFSTSTPKKNSATPIKPLYASQSSLPHLPVPTVPSTLHKYLETLEPILTPSELSASTTKVNAFLNSPLASTLQKRLEARASEKESWLSEWWNQVAYMGYRDYLVPNVSYFYTHKHGLGKGQSQEKRAAELVRGIREFRDMVVSERLEPEKVKGKALCTASYKNMFGAVRIPTKPADVPFAFPPQEAEHIIVMRKNRFFKVDTAGRSASELEKVFKEIKDTVGDQEGLVMGALTADNRDTWTDLRNHLISLSPSNALSIKAIDSSILLVCLDDNTPQGPQARSWSFWAGGEDSSAKGKLWNRWFDKHELIVDEAGESGFNGEHSMLDGTPTLRLNEFILGGLEKGVIQLELPESEKSKSGPLKAEEIKFITDSKINEGIHSAISGFSKVLGEHDLQVLEFTGYGKDVIKKHKCSPDAWVQMIKQLAYGKMTGGEPAVTYESAQTRKYKFGRTEVIRSCSKESKAFVDAMLGNASDAERAKLLRLAVARHIQYSSWAADGQGVDRHMFGLKMLLKEGEEMPEMFKDPAFAKSSHWTFSTSQLSTPYFDLWGYGEVVPDGFGLSYMIQDHSLTWGITTTTGKGSELKKSLEWAAQEVRRMMDSAAASAPAPQEKAKL